MKTNNRDARATRRLVQCFDVVCKRRREIFIFEVLTTTRAHISVNLSFFAFTRKPFVPSKRKCTPPILYNVINMQ